MKSSKFWIDLIIADVRMLMILLLEKQFLVLKEACMVKLLMPIGALLTNALSVGAWWIHIEKVVHVHAVVGWFTVWLVERGQTPVVRVRAVVGFDGVVDWTGVVVVVKLYVDFIIF
jgi:hypothetical protein